MLKTTTVTELRSDLSAYIAKLSDGPITIMSRSRPAAVLVDPEMFETLMKECELLEDILDGRAAVADYLKDRKSAVDAEEVFKRLGT
jgi:prevent-host-death family protein